jgi:hypothetical protein
MACTESRAAGIPQRIEVTVNIAPRQNHTAESDTPEEQQRDCNQHNKTEDSVARGRFQKTGQGLFAPVVGETLLV